MDADLVEELFLAEDPRPFLKDIQKGLDSLGIFKVAFLYARLMTGCIMGTPMAVAPQWFPLSNLNISHPISTKLAKNVCSLKGLLLKWL